MKLTLRDETFDAAIFIFLTVSVALLGFRQISVLLEIKLRGDNSQGIKVTILFTEEEEGSVVKKESNTNFLLPRIY